jgi:hypothetical protein
MKIEIFILITLKIIEIIFLCQLIVQMKKIEKPFQTKLQQ